MGVALVIAGVASMWVLVTSPQILEPFPLIERNSQYYCLTLIGSGILLLIAGTIFGADNREASPAAEAAGESSHGEVGRYLSTTACSSGVPCIGRPK